MGELAFPRPQALTDSHIKPRRKHNPNRRKPCPENHKRNIRDAPASNNLAKNLVMGQVKILKRGEELAVSKNREQPANLKKSQNEVGELNDLQLYSIGWLGPEPEMVSKPTRIADVFFAGSSGIVESPPASSLPLPLSLLRKTV